MTLGATHRHATVSPIQTYLDRLHDSLKSLRAGAVASYIPELAQVDPDALAIAFFTLDGTCYATGQADTEFTIQSMSKPFAYGQALEVHGRARVLQSVGVEPTGEAFNAIILDEENNRPLNPMVNAGAIAVANLLSGPDGAEGIVDLFSQLAARPLSVDPAVYRSEKDTGHRNRAIAYLMLNSGMIDNPPEDVIDLYFRQCAINITCRDLALMATTLANLGVNPVTGKRVFAAENVQDVLTLMNTCGMYDYAGQWAFDVGFPAKSGVSGGILAVLPGQGGFAIWSPRLDKHGNSVRGIAACREISTTFGLHAFAQSAHPGTVIRRAFHAGDICSKRVRSGEAHAHLTATGHEVRVLELQGALHFGAMETVLRDLTGAAGVFREILIDFAHASHVERPAARMLVQGLQSFANNGYTVILSGLGEARLARLLEEEIAREGLPHSRFDDLDSALEHVEERLLQTHFEHRDTARYALSDMAILSGLTTAQYRAIETVIRPHSYADGERILAKGDPGAAIYLVASGQAEARLAQRERGTRRLVSMGPGDSFGETALSHGSPQGMDIHAKGATLCYVLAVADLRALGASDPEILNVVLGNVVGLLAERLHQANEEIRNLG